MEALVELAIDYARRLKVAYAEARFQSDVRESIILKNGILEASVLEEERGISIRIVVDNSLGFAATNILTRRSVQDAVKKAFEAAKAGSRILKNGVSMSREEPAHGRVEVKPRVKPRDVDLESKVQLLNEADDETKAFMGKTNVKFPARILTLDTWNTEKFLMTSEGSSVYSNIPRAALFTLLTAYHPEKGSVQRFFNLGGTGGWEIVERWDLPKVFREEAYSLSMIALEAEKPPKGKMDVVLGPEVVGIVSHESCGHPSEADRILGREAAQAGETYLKTDSLGLRVGSPHVNVVDDPTVKGSFGFYRYDEEGVEARKRTLIKEGVINEFLHNRETASIFGVHSNGASRAAAYNREPIVRMANTFLEPGDHTKEELIEGVREGIYVKNFMEWNIDDRRFNQRYVGLEAYRIEKGELKERVRNPVLEITTVGLWSAVDAVGEDLEFQAAYCGKGDPLQGIPVWTGGPHVRLRDVRLGGE
ncbi:MAG: TldD/PmbA family protein [Candidatus Bathyarchaeia archaeon]